MLFSHYKCLYSMLSDSCAPVYRCSGGKAGGQIRQNITKRSSCLFWNRLVLISEAPSAYFGTPVRADLKSARREYRDLQSRNAFFALQMLIFNAVGFLRSCIQVLRRQSRRSNPTEHYQKILVFILESSRAYFGSA